MPAKTRNCSNCGGAAFNVLEDGCIVCDSCGTENAPPESESPPRTYNRAVKHQSGSGDSLWNGLASFLLFEHVSGGWHRHGLSDDRSRIRRRGDLLVYRT